MHLEDAKQARFGRHRHRLQAAAHRQRHLRKGHRVFRLRQIGKRGLSADALGQHHAVVHRLEVGAGVGQERGCTVRLRRADVGLGEKEANPPEAER